MYPWKDPEIEMDRLLSEKKVQAGPTPPPGPPPGHAAGPTPPPGPPPGHVSARKQRQWDNAGTENWPKSGQFHCNLLTDNTDHRLFVFECAGSKYTHGWQTGCQYAVTVKDSFCCGCCEGRSLRPQESLRLGYNKRHGNSCCEFRH